MSFQVYFQPGRSPLTRFDTPKARGLPHTLRRWHGSANMAKSTRPSEAEPCRLFSPHQFVISPQGSEEDKHKLGVDEHELGVDEHELGVKDDAINFNMPSFGLAS